MSDTVTGPDATHATHAAQAQQPESPLVFADLVVGARAHLVRVGLHITPSALLLHRPDGTVLRWAWDQLRRLPDQADRQTLVLSHAGDALSRLYLKDDALKQQVVQRAHRLNRRARTIPLSKLALWAGGAVASVAAIIFVLVPLMAAQLAEILPTDAEKALGDTTLDQIRTTMDGAGLGAVPFCEDPDGIDALQAMYQRLDPDSDLPYPVQIHVLDHDMVNAFALPGGHIVFFRGLIDEAETPEEVAAVLAHEIGHVVYRDPTRDALRSAGSLGVLGLLFGDFAGGTVTLFLANQLINASYSQSAESRADDYAHGLLESADVSPGALGMMFERMREKYGDAEGIVAHLASHPQMADRIEAAQAAVVAGRDYQSVVSAGEWRALQAVCEE